MPPTPRPLGTKAEPIPIDSDDETLYNNDNIPCVSRSVPRPGPSLSGDSCALSPKNVESGTPSISTPNKEKRVVRLDKFRHIDSLVAIIPVNKKKSAGFNYLPRGQSPVAMIPFKTKEPTSLMPVGPPPGMEPGPKIGESIGERKSEGTKNLGLCIELKDTADAAGRIYLQLTAQSHDVEPFKVRVTPDNFETMFSQIYRFLKFRGTEQGKRRPEKNFTKWKTELDKPIPKSSSGAITKTMRRQRSP